MCPLSFPWGEDAPEPAVGPAGLPWVSWPRDAGLTSPLLVQREYVVTEQTQR